jgi:hypothetical protein
LLDTINIPKLEEYDNNWIFLGRSLIYLTETGSIRGRKYRITFLEEHGRWSSWPLNKLSPKRLFFSVGANVSISTSATIVLLIYGWYKGLVWIDDFFQEAENDLV